MPVKQNAHFVLQPELDHETREGLRDYCEVYADNRDWFQRELDTLVSGIPAFVPLLDNLSLQEYRPDALKDQAADLSVLLDCDWDPLLGNLRQEGLKYALAGIPFASWTQLISEYRSMVMHKLQQVLGDNPERMLRAINALCRFLDLALGVIGEAYLHSKDASIKEKEEAIRALSTPVLQIREGMLILPVVGLVDQQRAQRLTDALLRQVRSNRARAVIMDITGLPTLDAPVTDQLVATIRAARFMGADVVITGISGELAMTLVGLGLDLSSLHTFGDLQSGLEWAEKKMGLQVIRRTD